MVGAGRADFRADAGDGGGLPLAGPAAGIAALGAGAGQGLGAGGGGADPAAAAAAGGPGRGEGMAGVGIDGHRGAPATSISRGCLPSEMSYTPSLRSPMARHR